jgi:hypothetical protein
MKKVLFAAIAVMAFGASNAQDMKFGVKAGLNNTNFTGDLDTDPQTSFYFGGLVDFTMSDKFHIQPELMYSGEGADDAAVSYLRLPVMAKYYVMEGFSLQVGPELAFKMGADDIVDDAIKSMDFGLGFGAGYELETGLFFDARYNYGMSNIYDGDGGEIGNTGIQFGLGYRF